MSAAQLIATTPAVSRVAEVEARVAYVRLVRLARPRGASSRTKGSDAAAWLSACYALTPRVERVSATAALLDLGRCTPAEALAAVRGLLERLRAHGRHAVAGIGPSMTIAQLALFGSPFQSGRGTTMALRSLPAPSPVRKGAGGLGSACSPSPRAEKGLGGEVILIATAEAPAFLRGVPVNALAALHGHERVTLEVVERLQRYGLRTLGHLARLGEPALRRQFGKAGAF
ncbi:MAG: hypothetical protein ACRDHE_00665, partial [Ktedonobacterales bacterium]